MFAHKIVEAIRHRAVDFNSYGLLRDLDVEDMQSFSELFDTTAQQIHAATKFDLGCWNVFDNEDLIGTAAEFSREGKLVLPCDPVWLDGVSYFDDRAAHWGILVNYTYSGHIFGMPWLYKSRNQVITPLCGFLLESGAWKVRPFRPGLFDQELLSRHPSGRAMQIALGAIAALSMTATKTIKRTAPESLNVKRAKRGRTPLFDYHVLVLDLANGHEDAGSVLGHGSNPRRLHVVRGHLRRRPHESQTALPSIVVPPHLRGLASLGAVNKDYRVRERALEGE